MPDQWLVFGGWGHTPNLLRPVFGEKSIYVDVNKLMPSLVSDGKLHSDWIDIVRESPACREAWSARKLAGWSTGAIIACGLALKYPVSNLVLLSSTPSFCKKQGFSHGMRPGVLDIMRRGLSRPGNSVTEDFSIRSGISGAACIKVEGNQQNLINGLHFLEQADLLPLLEKLQTNSRVLHGEQDSVIPPQAGKFLADALGAEFSLMSGGHAFFSHHPDMRF